MTPTPKKILIDCGQTRSLYAGLGQVAFQYAAALSALPQAGRDFAPHYIAHPRFAAFHAAARRGGWRASAPSFSLVNALRRLTDRDRARYIWRGAGHNLRHILHRNCCDIPPADSAPLIFTIHDMHLLDQPPARRRRALQQVRRLASRARALGFISNYARRIAAEHIDFGAAEQHIIYNGVNKPQNPRRPAWYSDALRPYLFAVSGLLPHKNYHILPPMLARLPGINIIIAGRAKKHYTPRLQQEIKKSAVQDRFLLTGPATEEEKAFLLANAAGFVFPSVREGFGMPIVEALHYGLPVFCFANTAIPEVGGDQARYWQDEDPATMADFVQQHLAADNAEQQQNRKTWAKQFSWQANAEQYAALYTKLAA